MLSRVYASSLETPFGPFSFAITSRDALVATAFGGIDTLAQRLHSSDFAHDPRAGAPVRQQLLEYFSGGRQRFDLEVRPAGTPFQQRVWDALREIPFGATRSYGALARELGSSPRAVGRANATNPICVVIPCHRVIGANGALTGFAFGERVKRALLEHERSLASAAAGADRVVA